MSERFFLPLLSLCGLILGLVSVVISHQSPKPPPILFPPAKSPYQNYIAAVGIIEASSENIVIGTPYQEVIAEVFVEPGDYVPQGAPLFRQNSNVLQKNLEKVKAKRDEVQAEYNRALDLPNPVDIPPLEDRVDTLQANYLDKLAQFELVDNIKREGAISKDEYNTRKFAALQAKFELKNARDELNKVLAGAWVRDLEIIRARLKEANAEVSVVEAQIADRTRRAPYSGVVLSSIARVGQLVLPSDQESTGVMLFGVVDPLHVRVDVDEQDLWRIIPGAPGVAFVRGNSRISVPLEFVRLEPFLVQKRALSGSTTELVDTRVIQLIYRFHPKDLPLYPGQLLDIFIESKPHEFNLEEEK